MTVNIVGRSTNIYHHFVGINGCSISCIMLGIVEGKEDKHIYVTSNVPTAFNTTFLNNKETQFYLHHWQDQCLHQGLLK